MYPMKLSRWLFHCGLDLWYEEVSTQPGVGRGRPMTESSGCAHASTRTSSTPLPLPPACPDVHLCTDRHLRNRASAQLLPGPRRTAEVPALACAKGQPDRQQCSNSHHRGRGLEWLVFHSARRAGSQPERAMRGAPLGDLGIGPADTSLVRQARRRIRTATLRRNSSSIVVWSSSNSPPAAPATRAGQARSGDGMS